MTPALPSLGLLGLASLASCLILVPACGPNARHSRGFDAAGSHSTTLEDRPMERPSIPVVPPPPGASVRVGGDLSAVVTGSDGDYRAGACRVDTPLPVGYPAPTPPGSMDLKTYPSVRLAEVGGAGDPDSGMNRTFWPLFNHIKGHGIAMTSPVEMNYRGMHASNRPAPESWSMAFLYRTPELNPTGVEGSIVVRDSDPVTVIAVGMKGGYSMSLVQKGMGQIEDWLAANPQWEPAGDWRALYYNGPTLLWWNKWAEVQLPVRPPVNQRIGRATAEGGTAGARP